MQLKACFAFLAAVAATERGAAASPASGEGLPVGASGEVSVYTDRDHVTVVTPTASVAVRDEDAGLTVSARYLLDAVSAASVDILSTASSRWSEVRHAVSADAVLTRGDFTAGANAAVSSEPDYLSISGGGRSSLSLDRHHVTVSGGYSLGHDTIGRAGTPFDVFHQSLFRHAATVGVSFVLGRSSLLGVGLDAVVERGDQSKPYRHVPMFDPAVARDLPNGASIELVNRVRRQETPLELLPLARERYALTARFFHRFRSATLRVSERGYADTWGLVASTTDARFTMDLSRRIELSSLGRFHVQQGVSFWKRSYTLTATTENGGIPYLRTGDRELGPLWTATFGGELRVALSPRFARNDRDGECALTLLLLRMRTAYPDTLYLDHRDAVFAAIGFEGTFF